MKKWFLFLTAIFVAFVGFVIWEDMQTPFIVLEREQPPPKPVTEVDVVRYDITVRVRFTTPSGPIVSATTAQIMHEVGPDYQGGAYARSRFEKGEAAVVRFENGKHAILLPKFLFISLGRVFDILNIPTEDSLKSIAKFNEMVEPLNITEMKPYLWMVTFTDLEDPLSVQKVTPDTIKDVIGDGYAIQSIEIEPGRGRPLMTGQIESFLPWLKTWPKNINLHGNRNRSSDATNPVADSLNRASFIKE